MAKLPEKYEVIMEIGFACTNGTEFIVANAKKVGDIVRCRDCKYVTLGGKFWNPLEERVCDYWEDDGIYPDDYCSHGERKEN